MGIILILDIIIVGYISFYTAKVIFGDGPLGRILAVLSCIICAFLYVCLIGWADNTNNSMIIGEWIFFGPIGLTLILLLLTYAFNGKKHSD